MNKALGGLQLEIWGPKNNPFKEKNKFTLKLSFHGALTGSPWKRLTEIVTKDLAVSPHGLKANPESLGLLL